MAKPVAKRQPKPKSKGVANATAVGKADQSAVERESRASQLSKWDPKFINVAVKMAELGAVDREIAEAIGICEWTFHAWKLRHPELALALKPAKEIADDIVVRSLFNRAKGYSFDSVKIFVDKDGREHIIPYVEHVSPDVTAQIFWLKNRRPDEWRDRHVVDVNLTKPEDLRAARLAARERARIVSEQNPNSNAHAA